MSYDLTNQTALITGANRGIGRVILDSLFANGIAKVYGAVRNPESMESAIEPYGDRVVPLELDLTKPVTIEQAASKATDVSLLINNAGVFQGVDALSPKAVENLKSEMDGNVYGLIRLAGAFAPVLKSNGGGAIVQLNSIVSMKCFPQFTTYCASKAASYAVSQAIRELLQPQGTVVVSVHPGPIATAMGDAAGLTDIAEPPQLVADAILDALSSGSFHAFAGTMAKQIGAAYEPFARDVVEAEMSEA